MIPLCDVIPSRTRPVATVGIIVLSALVFGLELALPRAARQALIRDYGLVFGDVTPAAVITSLFLHGSLLHAVGNMWYLWLFGPAIEDRLGHRRFLVFYLVGGAMAALLQALVAGRSRVPIVGASGAIAAVLGAYFVLFPRSRVLALVPLVVHNTVVEIPALWFLGGWLLLQAASSLGPVAYTASSQGGLLHLAHLAGFGLGAAGVFAFRRSERQRVEWWGG